MYAVLICIYLLGVSFLWGGAPCACAGVVFFDSVTTAHTPVYLTVRTKGLLLPEGGRLVDIFSEGRKLGRVMSGGDGYGYIKVIPEETGLKTYEARMNGDSDRAQLLVMEKTDRALLVEIEVLSRSLLSIGSGGGDAQKALNTLSEKFKLIYLTRFLGKSVAKRLMAAADLPASVVLPWQGPDLFEELKSRGVAVAAIVASADLISQAADEVPHRFTFEETEDETFVENWQDLVKKLP